MGNESMIDVLNYESLRHWQCENSLTMSINFLFMSHRTQKDSHHLHYSIQLLFCRPCNKCDILELCQLKMSHLLRALDNKDALALRYKCRVT